MGWKHPSGITVVVRVAMSRPPQTNLFVRAGGVFFVLFFMTVESARSQVGALASTVGTLRELAKNHGKYIGSCSRISALTDPSDPTYQQVLDQQFSLVTAENSCKFSETEPVQDNYTFADCSTILSAATTANQVLRGHNLVWGRLNPKWLTDSNFSSAKMSNILQNHVDTVLKHYGKQAFAWDVVNEAVSDTLVNGTFKDNDWYPIVKNYVDEAYLQAGKSRAGAGVKLFYNDYNIASMHGLFANKSQAVYDLLKDMRSRGIPVDGIGLQLHIDINYDQMAGVKENLKRLGGIGLIIHMTEIDVSCNSFPLPCLQWGEEEENKQAQVYAALMQACLDEDMCESFETWGFTDKYSWRGQTEHPLLFDENYQPKLAVTALMDTLQGNQTWVNAYYERVGNGTEAVGPRDDSYAEAWRKSPGYLSASNWVQYFRGKDTVLKHTQGR